MESLNNLLARLPIPGLKASNDRHAIASVLSLKLSIPITAKQVTFADDLVTVSVPPVVKSALKLHQTELLALLARSGIVARAIR